MPADARLSPVQYEEEVRRVASIDEWTRPSLAVKHEQRNLFGYILAESAQAPVVHPHGDPVHRLAEYHSARALIDDGWVID